jgi:hypothetical protein
LAFEVETCIVLIVFLRDTAGVQSKRAQIIDKAMDSLDENFIK